MCSRELAEIKTEPYELILDLHLLSSQKHYSKGMNLKVIMVMC